jgi:opacity protein-like surface antigen
MKKLILSSVFIILACCYVDAQEISKNALGLRFGGNNGVGAEVSYQRGLTENHRLEFDLGWRNDNNFDAFKLTGLYQWVWNIDGGFNWFAGAGAGIGAVDYGNDYNSHNNNDDTDFFAYAAGDIGIEYNFDFPLLIALDFRPELGFNDFNDDLDFDIALSARYQF